jgi:hypothetical protein
MSRPSDLTSSDDNTADDGVCILREAIEVANGTLVRDECGAGDAGFDEIRFAASTNNEDIDLARALPEHTIADDLRIAGNGPANPIVDGNADDRVLLVGAEASSTTAGRPRCALRSSPTAPWTTASSRVHHRFRGVQPLRRLLRGVPRRVGRPQ